MDSAIQPIYRTDPQAKQVSRTRFFSSGYEDMFAPLVEKLICQFLCGKNELPITNMRHARFRACIRAAESKFLLETKIVFVP